MPQSAAPHDIGPGRYACKDRVFARKTPRHCFGILGRDGQDFSYFVGVPKRRQEAKADTLDLVRPGGCPDNTADSAGSTA